MLVRAGRKARAWGGQRWLHASPPPLRLKSAKAMEAFGADMAAHVPHPSTVFLVGDLGCGKTCFARGFVRAWTKDPAMHVTSPTYLLMNTYENEAQRVLYHMDLYRLDSVSAIDAKAMGLDEAFDSCLNLIEWPDRLKNDLMPATRLEVHIAYATNTDERLVELKTYGDIWGDVQRWIQSKHE
ncbi:hypothetical protein ACHHYP_04671 [Achlya hypogyna]|uniref:tRNA threonylcarbamoyladenosine biosynthesis protein TsaE n=1 Tax=Achlya hypogyna TaxID=1202772 RepID=A0A1V9Z0C4_ACHHY|nr:hypothetical protein ACHHYP_04671 [Achlya hypogyna]